MPDADALFVWGEASFALADGVATTVELIVPAGRKAIEGSKLPLLASVARLAGIAAASVSGLPSSIASWVLASKFAIELVARERVVPTLARRHGRIEARWAVALSSSEDGAKLDAIARAMPPAAHAVPIAEGLEIWTADALLREFLDAVADALVRSTEGAPPLPAAKARAPWQERWRSALTGSEDRFEATGFGERTLIDDLERWSEPARGSRDRLRACFRLELPDADDDAFTLRFLLQSPDDPSLLVEAEDIWRAPGHGLAKFGRAFRDPQDSLLEALGRAARLFSPIEHALAEGTPSALSLDAADAWQFLSEGASALADAGFGVFVPSELTQAGQRRLRLRMRVGSKRKVAGQVAGASGLELDALLEFAWEAAIGETPLSARELAALAKHKAPLVRHRGAWVAIDPRELAEIQQRIAKGPGKISVREGLRLALAGEVRDANAVAGVRAIGSLAELIARIAQAAANVPPPPAALRAELRPYQTRGLAWLNTHASLGLGACLADDMGLGKTIQLLAFLLRRSEIAPDDRRPALLVAPTSVVGNWEREAERFAPSLIVSRHYGSERVRSADQFTRGSGALVVTTYGLLRRDAALLAEIEWSTVALDEAQNIKNAASATASAARGLRASHRFALTGTPVENRLAELWSILEFANPGLLGSLEA
ncbi:MAG TPA: DEAD/DEAH box helicase, partial [Polyangiales bacterium]|nr:DEAD/DEAH box helicase [Polyangiales bacterium]